MKQTVNTITKVMVLMLFIGLTMNVSGQSLPQEQQKLIETEVDSSFQEMLRLAEQLDYDAMNKGVDDHHKAGFIVNGQYYSDYASLIATIKQGAQGVSKQELNIKEKKITVLGKNIALLSVSGGSVVLLDDGREFTGDFYWSFVYEKINDSWKVVQSHQSQGR